MKITILLKVFMIFQLIYVFPIGEKENNNLEGLFAQKK